MFFRDEYQPCLWSAKKSCFCEWIPAHTVHQILDAPVFIRQCQFSPWDVMPVPGKNGKMRVSLSLCFCWCKSDCEHNKVWEAYDNTGNYRIVLGVRKLSGNYVPKIKVCAELWSVWRLCVLFMFYFLEMFSFLGPSAFPFSRSIAEIFRDFQISLSCLCYFLSPLYSVKPSHKGSCDYLGTCQVICSDLLHQKSWPYSYLQNSSAQ